MPINGSELRTLPLLMHLPDVTLEHLSRNTLSKSVSKREVVAQKGERSAHLGFLRAGRLQGIDYTNDGREVGLYFFNPGDYFCEISIIDSAGQPEIITAISKSEILLIPKDIIRPILFGVPKIAESLCQRLTERLREGLQQRRIIGLPNPVQRLCAQLEILMQTGDTHRVHLVRDTPTHQELAIMINASRETVTRAFQLLLGRGLIERRGNDLCINQPETLSLIARGEADISNL